MTSILKELQQYVPVHSSEKPIGIALGGDQLTAERVRTCQDLRKHSFIPSEQLDGFVPFTADWHAEVILLQVYIIHNVICHIILAFMQFLASQHAFIFHTEFL